MVTGKEKCRSVFNRSGACMLLSDHKYVAPLSSHSAPTSLWIKPKERVWQEISKWICTRPVFRMATLLTLCDINSIHFIFAAKNARSAHHSTAVTSGPNVSAYTAQWCACVCVGSRSKTIAKISFSVDGAQIYAEPRALLLRIRNRASPHQMTRSVDNEERT